MCLSNDKISKASFILPVPKINFDMNIYYLPANIAKFILLIHKEVISRNHLSDLYFFCCYNSLLLIIYT
ncbi:hypothetical protein SPPR111872_16740 [Sphingobacterium prati]